MSGKVYFVKGHNSIKIGFTKDFEKRINSLNTSSPVNLSLLCLVDGDRAIEKALHEKFKPFQINREWFKDVPEIHEEIERLNAGIFPVITASPLWDDNAGGAIINKDVPSVKLYNNKRLSESGLPDADLLKTYKLSEYIVKNTNIIGKKNSFNGYGSTKDISVILGITEKKAREYLSRAVKAKILTKISVESGGAKIDCYAFNPIYVNSCKYVPAVLYNEFWDDIDKVIPEWMQDRYRAALQERRIKIKKDAEKQKGG